MRVYVNLYIIRNHDGTHTQLKEKNDLFGARTSESKMFFKNILF